MGLTHFDGAGNAVMVDVSEKAVTDREAVAKGRIRVSKAVYEAVENGRAAKGDVLGIARIAGIMAVKKTSDLIPLCHVLQIGKASVDFRMLKESYEIEAVCTVKALGKTGVEMEALTGASAALLTIYDMCKAIDKGMEIHGIRLERKSGGKSGTYLGERKDVPDRQSYLGVDQNMGRVAAICTSEKKGTQKKAVPAAVLRADWGIEGDAHAGNWHRQVSLLSMEKIEEFRAKGAEVDHGAFGENLVVEGFDLACIPVGTRFGIGEAVVELTQIGKECHGHCAIYHAMGDCIMPREGVFARVIKGGEIHPGDTVKRLPFDGDRPFTAAIITLSDKGYAGEREDKSGPIAREMLTAAGYEVVEALLLPDGEEELKRELIRLAEQRQVNVIFTTGGTGFSERDVTPEATKAVCDRMAMGVADAIRIHSLTITDRAMLSRAVSGIRKRTLIVNLPGSPKAVREGLEHILPALGHGLCILRGTLGDCSRQT